MFPVRSLLIGSSCLALIAVQLSGQERSSWQFNWSQRFPTALVRNTLIRNTLIRGDSIAAPLSPPNSEICQTLENCLKSCPVAPTESPTESPQAAVILLKGGEEVISQGRWACVNDRPVALPWLQVQSPDQSSPGQLSSGQSSPDQSFHWVVEDFALADVLNLTLLESDTPEFQPVDWFGFDALKSQFDALKSQTGLPLALGTTLGSERRYVSLSPLLEQGGWSARQVAAVLHLNIPTATVQALRLAQQAQGYRVVLELDRPGLFTTQQENDRWSLILEGALASSFSEAELSAFLQQDPVAQVLQWQMYSPLPRLTANPNNNNNNNSNNNNNINILQTIVSATLPPGLVPQVSRLSNPHRLVIDFQPRSFVPKTIAWAEGITWQQAWISANHQNKAFAVVWLTLEPAQWNESFQLSPLLPRTHRQSIAQLQSLPRLVEDTGAIVAINGGYFNRNNQLPLGAIRAAGDWISGPILGRGGMAWKTLPEKSSPSPFYFDRFSLQESVSIAGTTQTIPLTHLNSGYVKAGIARYTPFWGRSYSPLIDGEMVLTIINDRLTQVQRTGKAGTEIGTETGTETIPIPDQGYLLTARASDTSASQLTVGMPVQLQQTYQPPVLAEYSNLIGAGPLLVKNGRVVVDAVGESFSPSFSQQAALRSAIGQTAQGQLLIVAIVSTPSGAMPTLPEMAELMLKLGAIDALNLDGGSSSSLYLGGKILNRPPRTAARIHNGLGLVYTP